MESEIQFSQNLKMFRKKAGLTRQELAQQLNYSVKAVEKWETGQSVPGLPTICKIAEVLGVRLEHLVYAESSEIRYFLGIDGGGTKTTFLLENADGKELARCDLGASNPNDVGMEQCAAVLENGISQVTANVDIREVSVFAGLAGGISEENAERIKKILSRFEFGLVRNGSDVDNALEMCLHGGDGVVVIAGTGSIAFAQQNGQKHRIGGWGYLFDSGGSGYNLGRDALEAAYRMLDGRGEETILLPLLEAKLETSLEEAIPELYHGGKRMIGSFATTVFEACDAGDAIAIQILQQNMKYLSELIQTAQKYVDRSNTPVVICGGLAHRDDLLGKYLREYLPEDCILQFCKEEMVNGAVQCARKNYLKEEYHGENIY